MKKILTLILLVSFVFLPALTARADLAVEDKGVGGSFELDEDILGGSLFDKLNIVRSSGATRYETAIENAKNVMAVTGATRFSSVIIANGRNFPDALAGSFLSAVKNAPILLVSGGSSIDGIEEAVNHLTSTGTVYLLGGEQAVPAEVAKALDGGRRTFAPGLTVKRLDGADRYATNLSILREGNAGSFEDLVVCDGRNYADALSASALGRPILLVDSRKAALSAEQRAFVSGGFKNVYIFGGEKAVPTSVASELEQASGAEVIRIGGADRYETSALIAREFFAAPDCITIATGRNFPDGLTGGLLAKCLCTPLILVKDGASDYAAGYVNDYGIGKLLILGGENAVSDELAQKVMPGPVKAAASKISYEFNGGESENAPSLYYEGRRTALPEPVREGYSFAGWYTDKALTKWLEYIERGTHGDVTVYAKWYLDPLFISGDNFGLIKQDREIQERTGANIARVKAFEADLFAKNIMEDYTKNGFTWDSERNTSWFYYNGLIINSFMETDPESFRGEIKKFALQHVKADGSIKDYIIGEVDSALPAVCTISLIEDGNVTPEEKTKLEQAINYTWHQLQSQLYYPEAGGLLQHSERGGVPTKAWTKWNVALDGIYMSQLFTIRMVEAIDAGLITVLNKDGTPVDTVQVWDEIYDRLCFAAEHFRDEKNGLLNHGYCVATGETNGIPWSRGMGWYVMALVEGAEKCPDPVKREVLAEHFRKIMAGIIKWQDPVTLLWYNVTDGREEVEENRTETSGSSMFSYVLLRGYYNGTLDARYARAGLRAFNSLVELKLKEEGFIDTLKSSGVTSNRNRYWVSGYAVNDAKGLGPLFMAAYYAALVTDVQ